MVWSMRWVLQDWTCVSFRTIRCSTIRRNQRLMKCQMASIMNPWGIFTNFDQLVVMKSAVKVLVETMFFKPFLPNIPFWSPWKHQKTFGFLMFSERSKGNIGKKSVNSSCLPSPSKSSNLDIFQGSWWYLLMPLTLVLCYRTSHLILEVCQLICKGNVLECKTFSRHYKVTVKKLGFRISWG